MSLIPPPHTPTSSPHPWIAVTRDSYPTPRWWEHMGCPTSYTPIQHWNVPLPLPPSNAHAAGHMGSPISSTIWNSPGWKCYRPYRHAQQGPLVTVKQQIFKDKLRTRVARCKWWPEKYKLVRYCAINLPHRSIQGRRLNLCWFSTQIYT